MSPTRSSEQWDERYRQGDLPWDARRPESRLTDLVATLDMPARLALDLGCGTGDNALWLARHGHEVLGIDIAPAAIAIAGQRARDAGVSNARFVCASVLDPLPVGTGSAGLALDRGYFHVLHEHDRQRFAQQVADALAPGG